MRFLALVLLCVLTAPAFAGLFADEEARKQIEELTAQLAKQTAQVARLEEANKQQTQAMLDLQTQIEALTVELRKLRGLNEEFSHNLQDAEKRQKDFYVDLDGRLRRFEAVDDAVADKVTGTAKADDPGSENRAYEAAFAFYKAESYQNAVLAFREFLKRYPQSVHAANAYYWMANASFVLKDYQASLASYQTLVGKYDNHPKVQDAWLAIVDCQLELKDKAAAKKTLKLIIGKFPDTELSSKAKKRLAAIK